MARLTGPESGSRLAYEVTGTGALRAAVGLVATVYADADAAELADILTVDGDPITGSHVTVGADSQLPLFQFPDGVDLLWARVTTGPVTAIYARAAASASGVSSVDGQDGDVDLSTSYDPLGAAMDAQVSAEAYADAAVSAHTVATDPHGDRVYSIVRSHHTGTQVMSTISDAGTAATRNVGTTTGTVAAGDDARLSDTRTPTDNTVTSAKIVDATIVDADISGSAAIALSKLATNPLARANHTGTQAMATISDAGGAATKNVGTSAGTVAAGDDSRFTDTRTPTDNTVTSAKIADGAIVNADINAAAGIVLSKLAVDPLARANHTGAQAMATISDAGTAATKNVGTSTGTVAAGDDSRLSDTRTPTDNSVTSAKIVDATIVDGDISGSAAIALSKLATNPVARANHTGTQLAATISDLGTAVDTAGYGTWTDIASLGTNTGHGTPHAQSRTAPGGKTELRGQLLFSGAISANATIATVPAGQLPYGAVQYAVRWAGSGSANTFLNIDASGHLSVATASLVNGNTLNLDGISFPHA